MRSEFWKDIVSGMKVGVRMNRQKLLGEYFSGVFLPSESPKRQVYDDAVRYVGGEKVEFAGVENLPRSGGAMVVFNHPYGDVLFLGMLEFVKVLGDETGRKDFCVMMGGSMPLHNALGEALYPMSNTIIDRFADLFPDNVLKVPSKKGEWDYRKRRNEAKQAAVKAVVEDKKIFALSPAGAVDGQGTPRRGAGEIGLRVSEAGSPVIPVALWEEKGTTFVRVGKGFDVLGQSYEEAAMTMVTKISELMPGNGLIVSSGITTDYWSRRSKNL
jgi:hypothetical protein